MPAHCPATLSSVLSIHTRLRVAAPVPGEISEGNDFRVPTGASARTPGMVAAASTIAAAVRSGHHFTGMPGREILCALVVAGLVGNGQRKPEPAVS